MFVMCKIQWLNFSIEATTWGLPENLLYNYKFFFTPGGSNRRIDEGEIS
ncbi:putative retrotransposon protein [Arthrospira platensis C1]|nr:putative retrotransposon protein [Arthrospira platensis C1]